MKYLIFKEVGQKNPRVSENFILFHKNLVDSSLQNTRDDGLIFWKFEGKNPPQNLVSQNPKFSPKKKQKLICEIVVLFFWLFPQF